MRTCVDLYECMHAIMGTGSHLCANAEGMNEHKRLRNLLECIEGVTHDGGEYIFVVVLYT